MYGKDEGGLLDQASFICEKRNRPLGYELDPSTATEWITPLSLRSQEDDCFWSGLGVLPDTRCTNLYCTLGDLYHLKSDKIISVKHLI